MPKDFFTNIQSHKLKSRLTNTYTLTRESQSYRVRFLRLLELIPMLRMVAFRSTGTVPTREDSLSSLVR